MASTTKPNTKVPEMEELLGAAMGPPPAAPPPIAPAQPRLMDLPREALEHILLMLDPTHIVQAGPAAPERGSAVPLYTEEQAQAQVSCSIPLACTCRTLREVLLDDGGGGEEHATAPLAHRIIARVHGDGVAAAVLRCLPGGSDQRIALQLTASWHRQLAPHLAASRHELQIAADQDEVLEEHSHLSVPLQLLPLAASSSDHNDEVIEQTVRPPRATVSRLQRGEYWSSVSQQADTRDFLSYRLPGLCAVSSL